MSSLFTKKLDNQWWVVSCIFNVYRMRGYNSVNLRVGYPTLNIHSPKEIVGFENEE